MSALLLSLISSAAGAAFLAAVHYVKTGKPPILDRRGAFPRLDRLRDLARGLLAAYPEDAVPPTSPAPPDLLKFPGVDPSQLKGPHAPHLFGRRQPPEPPAGA